MRSLKTILKDYEADIKHWDNDFGEGHLFLGHREELAEYESDERVRRLDALALEVIEKDKSIGSDKLFLQGIKKIILHSGYNEKVA